MEKTMSHVEHLFILWILRESSQLLQVLMDTGVCCSDCEAGTRPWNSRAWTMTAPGGSADAKPITSMEQCMLYGCAVAQEPWKMPYV